MVKSQAILKPALFAATPMITVAESCERMLLELRERLKYLKFNKIASNETPIEPKDGQNNCKINVIGNMRGGHTGFMSRTLLYVFLLLKTTTVNTL